MRKLSRTAQLFTWNKPAYACLATRIPWGARITSDALNRIEQGETHLASLGFQDFRIRLHGDTAVVQVTESQFSRVLELRGELYALLSPIFPLVTLDFNPRQPGE